MQESLDMYSIILMKNSEFNFHLEYTKFKYIIKECKVHFSSLIFLTSVSCGNKIKRTEKGTKQQYLKKKVEIA